MSDVLVRNVFEQPEKYINEIIKEVKMPKEKRKKFIEFINKSNNGYLLVIGGGEPFKKYEHILKIVKEVKTDRLILVTNGMWAQDYENAKKVIFELHEEFKKRSEPTKLILRLSIDKWHAQKIGYELIDNIINVYKKYFREEEEFELQLHTLIGDNILDEVAKRRRDFEIIRTEETGISDNEEVIKISPYRCRLNFDDGYVIYVGIAKLFYSTLKPKLVKNQEQMEKAIEIFDNDMEFSAFDNPSVILNKNGTLGLNFWVNHNAVIRSKAINIRDYAGAAILEEKKTILYYAIRIIQDYIKEEKLEERNIERLSIELKEILKMNTNELVQLYNASDYTIISQYQEKKEFNEDEWRDLFELIKLGHYDVSKEQIEKGINFYNSKATNKIKGIEEIVENSKEQYDRLNEKLTFMKKEAVEFCKNREQCKEERFKTPSAVGLLLIRENNGKEEVLLQKRKNTGYMDGYYDVGASGHVEDKETMKMALIREAKEEIGIDIEMKDVNFITIIHDISKNVYYNGYFKVTKWSGEPIIGEKDKIEELKWFDINELPDNIIKNRKQAIDNYKANIPYSEEY